MVLLGFGLTGCTSRIGANGNADGEDAADDVEADGDSSMTLGTGVTETDDDGDGTDDAGGEDHGDGCGFLGCEDVPLVEQCDFWAQDCPLGEKCTAVASMPGFGAWDANLCVRAGSAGVGEPCTRVADAPPGTDTCDELSMCWDIDGGTGIGRCIGFCQAPEEAPTCPGAVGEFPRCMKFLGGVLNVCMPPCNPLDSGECPTGQHCVASFDGYETHGFMCFPPSSENASGEECTCVNCCAEHHMCVTAAEYGPGCAFDSCCTPYCDLDDPSPPCDGGGQTCVALFPPDMPFVGEVGRCAVP